MMNSSINGVTFLSLGPGDPELLTLKAVRLLEQADMVAVPATCAADGQSTSRALAIIDRWVKADNIHLYPLPMSHRREAALQVYDRICRDVAKACRDGQRVVVAVEGDVSIYASIHYVLEKLQADGIPVTQSPGIPSFIAAAAIGGLSLVSQRQRLVVVPGDADADTLQQLLSANHVVVVMKLSQCADALKDFLNSHPAAVCHYFENVGTSEAYHTSRHDDILSRKIPYFSLCILFPA